MKSIRSLLVLLCAWSLAASLGAEEEGVRSRRDGKHIETIERTVDARSGGTLQVQVDRGSVNVETWDEAKVRVQVEKKADVIADAEADQTTRLFHIV